MDYEKLKQVLPKQPIKWNVNDIAIWLEFIGLEALYPAFKNAAIDGSCLSSLTQEDLRTQLQIQSGITVKKLITWIRVGMKQYQQFLKTQNQIITGTKNFKPEQTLIPNNQLKNITQKGRKEIKNLKNINQMLEQPRIMEVQKKQVTLEKQESIESEFPKKELIQLIIQQFDGPQTSFYSLKSEGGKIGRHSSNQILILQESISRYHAEIQFENGQFYLKDSGSTTGTFLKLINKTEMEQGMILQMGSNHFLVQKIEGCQLKFLIIEGPNINQQLEIQIKKPNKISLGRKSNNEIAFPDDQHLSNCHAHIFMIQDKFYIEDLTTTNGTWRRLSPEAQESQRFLITNNTVFKIGSNLTYICKKNTAQIIQKPLQNTCAICYQNDKDCVYIPCKHNAACIKCSKSIKECPICRIKIQDFIKIYRS